MMTRKLASSTMRPPLEPVPEVGGMLYLHAPTTKLPWKAKLANSDAQNRRSSGECRLQRPKTPQMLIQSSLSINWRSTART